jgi:hypothetical protein
MMLFQPEKLSFQISNLLEVNLGSGDCLGQREKENSCAHVGLEIAFHSLKPSIIAAPDRVLQVDQLRHSAGNRIDSIFGLKQSGSRVNSEDHRSQDEA